MSKRAVVAVVAVLLLTGCAPLAPTPPPDATSTPEVAPVPGPSPEGLVNVWRVVGAEGTGVDSWLRLEGPGMSGMGLTAWTDCGVAQGQWRAIDGLFTGFTYSGPLECLEGDPATSLEWLTDVVGYREAGAGYELLDRSGEVVAGLAIDGMPPADPTLPPEFAAPPVLTPELLESLEMPEALPEGVEPASDILGRWEPHEVGEFDHPFANFSADGSWTASDGCNGYVGRWGMGAEGLILIAGGNFSTLIGCINSPAPYWVAGAARAGMIDGELVLYSRSGDELGHLERP